MLDSLIPPYTHTSASGGGILKALQNDTMPEIDLFIRESIQNSADAALKMKGGFSRIEFKIGSFSPKKLNAELEVVSHELDRQHPEAEARYIEVRDSKTAGLTGPVTIKEAQSLEDHGNYFKLIFESGEEQTNSTAGQAGGSWGYGKSVYYRAGIGLVMYYSRISPSESRLIFAMIENKKNKNSVLRKAAPDSVGRAWWGILPAKTKGKKTDPGTDILPITDESEIERILNIFDLEPFQKKETGTSIVIPYIDEKRFLEGIFPDDCGVNDDVIDLCSWRNHLEEYMKLSASRWYAPKIGNKSLNAFPEHKWLDVRINDVAIRSKDMNPIFQLAQELYSSALYANANMEYAMDNFCNEIEVVKIPSRRIQGGVAGHAAVARIPFAKLQRLDCPQNPRIYLRLFSFKNENDPIVMFSRTPGLILDYKNAGPWAQKILRSEEEEVYTFVFFAPICDREIKAVDTGKDGLDGLNGLPLGEYLRRCEKSDHMNWEDSTGVNIITNIQGQIASKINAKIKPLSVVSGATASVSLANRLGRRLLPSLKEEKKRGRGGSGGEGGGSTTTKNLKMTIEPPSFYGDCTEVPFQLLFSNSRKSASFELFVQDESGATLGAKQWRDLFGTAFPMSISSIEACKSQTDAGRGAIAPFTNDWEEGDAPISNELSSIDVIREEPSGPAIGFTVNNTENNLLVYGALVLASDDRKLACSLAEAKRGDNG